MSIDRITTRFAALRSAGRKGLIPFITAGDPNRSASAELLAQLPAAGADLIELGIPFSDPMADGPSIQAASGRALQGGMNVAGVLALAAGFRANDDTTPLIAMGYLNPILQYGIQEFARDAARSGIDGVITVDMPPEESDWLADAFAANQLAQIRLATPTTKRDRLKVILNGASGFLYLVAVRGVTGTAQADMDELAGLTSWLREASELPVAIGFGIRTTEQARATAALGDAVVVGSVLVEQCAEFATQPDQAVSAVCRLVKQLTQSMQDAGR